MEAPRHTLLNQPGGSGLEGAPGGSSSLEYPFGKGIVKVVTTLVSKQYTDTGACAIVYTGWALQYVCDTRTFLLELRTSQRFCCAQEEPFVMLVDGHQSMRGNARFEGFCVDLIEDIAQDLGFQYELYLVPDEQFGARDENGSWNGLVRELMIGVR